MEIVNLRLKMDFEVEKPQVEGQLPSPGKGPAAPVGESWVVYRDGPMATPLYLRETLAADCRLAGPALVIQMDTTIVVPPGWAGTVDSLGNLVLEPEYRSKG